MADRYRRSEVLQVCDGKRGIWMIFSQDSGRRIFKVLS